mgnify:CR=1 FL=1
MSNFLYQHGLESLAEKFGTSTAQMQKIAAYAAEVGGFSEQKVVKVLWAAKSPSVKELLEYLKLLPNQPEEAETLDPFEINPHSRNTVMHSPQNEPAGSQLGLFSIPSGESSPTTPLE